MGRHPPQLQDNNIPELAFETARRCIEKLGIDIHKDIVLGLTHRDNATEVFSLK